MSEATVVMEPRGRPSMTQDVKNRGNYSIAYIVIAVLALIAGGAVALLLMNRSSAPSNLSVVETNSNERTNRPTNVASNQANARPVPSPNNEETVQYPDAARDPLTAESVRNLLAVWEKAQESKSFSSYQACYDPSFIGIKKTKSGSAQSYKYGAWMADRRRMIASAVNLSIEMSNMQVSVHGDTAIVQFDQYYRSLRYSDWGPKEITVRMTPAGPKIVREELKASYPL